MTRELRKEEKLLALCEQFVQDNKISCEDAVYQSDRVMENATDLVADICRIVGYWEWDEDTE